MVLHQLVEPCIWCLNLLVWLQSVELQRLGIDNIPGQDGARVVHLNAVEGATKRKFCTNAVHTAK